MFCVLSQNYRHACIVQGTQKLALKIFKTVLNPNLKTAWSTKISMSSLSSLDNVLYDTRIIFRKNVDDFEIAHKNMLILS